MLGRHFKLSLQNEVDAEIAMPGKTEDNSGFVFVPIQNDVLPVVHCSAVVFSLRVCTYPCYCYRSLFSFSSGLEPETGTVVVAVISPVSRIPCAACFFLTES